MASKKPSLVLLASKKPSLVQLPCAKTREFGEAEFSDCLPVSASVCVFAFDTGGLGLWLGAFGRSRLYRCQSAPGPPMPCFVAQSFVLAAFATLVCQRNCGFSLQRHKTAKSVAFCDSLPVFCGTELRFCGTELWGPKPVIPTNAFAAGNSCFTNSRVQKLKNSAKPNSGTVCRFSMEGSCIGFWKSKANSTFCKVVKQKGEMFWHRNTLNLCNCLVPKLQKATLFAIVCRLTPWGVFSFMEPAICIRIQRKLNSGALAHGVW